MTRSRFLALLFALLLPIVSCRHAAPQEKQTAYAEFPSASADPLQFGFDWRMGLADTIRAGSAMFFRFELSGGQAEQPPRIAEINIVDRFASQYGIGHELTLVEGREKVIGIVSLAPEETAKLPAGPYELAVELRLENGTVLLSHLLPFELLPRTRPLGERQRAEERRRFAALLQLRGDRNSYDVVAPHVLDASPDILVYLLRYYGANAQAPVTGEREGDAVRRLSEYTREGELSVRERELAILALEELYARHSGTVRSDK